jgi:hypothetical protein
VLQHAAHNTFTSRDIASQTNYVLPGPVAHLSSILSGFKLSSCILMSFAENSNVFYDFGATAQRRF